MTARPVPPRPAFVWISCDAEGCTTRTKSAALYPNREAGYNADVAARGWAVVGPSHTSVTVYHYCPAHRPAEDEADDGPEIDRQWEANYRAHSSSITGITEGM